MSSKRTRKANSSTLFASDISLPTLQSETGDAEQQPRLPSGGEEKSIKLQPYNPKKVVKQFEAASVDQSRRRSIFTISTDDDPVREAGGLKLSDRCHYCNAKFIPSADMFMYKDNAFCKVECRQFQMNHDSMVSQRSEEGKKQLARNECQTKESQRPWFSV